jgi:hypothetical protein
MKQLGVGLTRLFISLFFIFPLQTFALDLKNLSLVVGSKRESYSLRDAGMFGKYQLLVPTNGDIPVEWRPNIQYVRKVAVQLHEDGSEPFSDNGMSELNRMRGSAGPNFPIWLLEGDREIFRESNIYYSPAFGGEPVRAVKLQSLPKPIIESIYKFHSDQYFMSRNLGEVVINFKLEIIEEPSEQKRLNSYSKIVLKSVMINPSLDSYESDTAAIFSPREYAPSLKKTIPICIYDPGVPIISFSHGYAANVATDPFHDADAPNVSTSSSFYDASSEANTLSADGKRGGKTYKLH